jgi:seryl-tRNA synthetase
MNQSKEVLVKTIKEWINVENEMKQIQKHMKVLREKKKKLSEALVSIMKTNEVDCFDLSEGKIMYTKNNTKTPLSKKHLLDCLNTYFAENPTIQPEDVAKYILDNRQTVVKEGIRHKLNNVGGNGGK